MYIHCHYNITDKSPNIRFGEATMNVYTAKCLLVREQQDWNRPHLSYLPESLYGFVRRFLKRS